MIKLLGNLVGSAGNILGVGKDGTSTNGLMSVIKEKTGKISFRRSLPIYIVTAILTPVVVATGTITWPVAIIIVACLVASFTQINIAITKVK